MVGDVGTTRITGFTEGVWYFAVIAENVIGNMSAYSEELMLDISIPTIPDKPTGCTIVQD